MDRLMRNYRPELLYELIRMGYDARNDTETAMYRQHRFFCELEARGFLEQPGFENLSAEMEEFKQIRKHYEALMDRILKRLRELNEAMIEAENTVSFSVKRNDDSLTEAFESIDQVLEALDREIEAENNKD